MMSSRVIVALLTVFATALAQQTGEQWTSPTSSPRPTVAARPSPEAGTTDVRWSHYAVLDPEGKVHLWWNPGTDGVVFELAVQTLGWVGLGFSPTGAMPMSDVVVGWVVGGEPTLQDRFAEGHSEPTLDQQQDYELLQGTENATHTILRFSRRYDTCDSKDFRISNDSMRVIYSYSEDDPQGPSILPHTKAGSRTLFLAGFNNVLDVTTLPSIRSWDIRMPNVSVPRQTESFCWRQLFQQMPGFEGTVMIGYEPVIRDTNAAILQHLWLFRCNVQPGQEESFQRLATMKGSQCYAPETPPEYNNCTRLAFAWAQGSQGDFTPLDVGYPVGKDASAAQTFYVLEAQYTATTSAVDTIDDSGLRLYFALSSRPTNAGVLTVGQLPGLTHLIPLQQQSFTTVGVCDSSCTSKALQPEGILIYDVLLYAKSAGRKLKLKHIRNGQELPPIAEDNAYVSVAQANRRLLSPVHILPGDSLVLECTYNTNDAGSSILGGYGKDNETCLAFLHYFPRTDLRSCLSSPALQQFFDWLGTKQVLGISPSSFEEISPVGLDAKLTEFLQHYNWHSRLSEYQNFAKFGSFTPICLMRNETLKDAPATESKMYPRVEHPYYALDPCSRVPENDQAIAWPTERSDPTGHDHDHSHHDHTHDHSHDQDQKVSSDHGFMQDSPPPTDHGSHQHDVMFGTHSDHSHPSSDVLSLPNNNTSSWDREHGRNAPERQSPRPAATVNKDTNNHQSPTSSPSLYILTAALLAIRLML